MPAFHPFSRTRCSTRTYFLPEDRGALCADLPFRQAFPSRKRRPHGGPDGAGCALSEKSKCLSLVIHIKTLIKRVISCRCREIYISLTHITIKPTLMKHGNTRKHPSSSLTIDDEWDGETFIEYQFLKQILIWKNTYSYSLWFCYHW